MLRREEIDRLAEQFGIRAGIRLHEKAEDYHFPEGSFLSQGYSPPGGYVKDFSLIGKEGRLHLFHIDGRPGEVCWVTGNEISFGHASTSDGCRWIRHPMPLAVGDRPWESEHIWAPYVYRRNGLYYMFYMGCGRGETFISYATSGDLERWERWAGGPIRCAVGRDPFVFDHAEKTILLYTGHGGARVSGCASRDMIQWEPLPDLMRIPGGAAAESCSLHPIHGKYVLWFNDYGPELAGFRAAYAFSEDPLRFDPAVIREFRFVTGNPAATPAPELRVDHPVPLSIELIAAGRGLWVAAYFRWHIDRNRLFFGSIDWSSDPATIKEINDEAELDSVLREAGTKSLGDVEPAASGDAWQRARPATCNNSLDGRYATMINDRPLFEVPEGVQTRWASAENWDGEKGAGGQANNGRKGSPCFRLSAGEQKVLAHAENTCGTIRRIWMTISDMSPAMLRGIRIDMFWDGADLPAVSAPLGDFFGQGLGRCATFESALFSNPEGRSFNSYVPMPFRKSMRIVVTNESGKDIDMFFYDVNYTLGDRLGNDAMYFHAHWRRERPTTIKQDYEFLPEVTGRGRFVGVNCGVIADTETYFKSWWGEGECRIYLDGDEEYPTLCGTGTEDYIGTAWGQGQYAHLYQGCHLADGEGFQFSFYRYHIPDPVYFQRNIRATIHQIGCWSPENAKQMRDAGRKLLSIDGTLVDLDKAVKDNGYGLFERQDDWSSCAYFYLNRPTNDLPVLAPVHDRTIGLFSSEDTNARVDA